MFGIGGGELIFIMFIVLMLFGSDKVPEIARTMGKAMAQLKHATNDIKNEIQKGAEANSFPANRIMEGGSASIEDMIKDTKKGVLVTRFWYIRAVDPQTLLYTGLTRDGTFYIENGKIKHPIKNFRFNESPIIMLNNLETLGKQMRVGGFGGGSLIPAMKVRDFTFSSLSDAV